jgi:5'-3' exonuclease
MIALIDGDVLAYGACRTRWQDKAKDGVVYRELDEDGNVKPLDFSTKENQIYLQESWENLKINLRKMLDAIYCDDYLMAVKGDGNFRDLIYSEYKANRRKNVNNQNLFVPVLRKLMVMEDLAVEAHNREADDMLRIWAEQCRMFDIDYIICSIDKDLKCIPGKHYLMHKEIMIDVSEAEAMRHYYEQLLKGDSTDNIPGIPKVGEIKAKKLLVDCETEEEFQEVVLGEYVLAYGADWHHHMLVNAKLIHLQRDVGDYFSFVDWPLAKELVR